MQGLLHTVLPNLFFIFDRFWQCCVAGKKNESCDFFFSLPDTFSLSGMYCLVRLNVANVVFFNCLFCTTGGRMWNVYSSPTVCPSGSFLVVTSRHQCFRALCRFQCFCLARLSYYVGQVTPSSALKTVGTGFGRIIV